jgi:hypothetical protein
MARRPNHRGRVTPKSDATGQPSSSEGATPPPVAGRRPSNPGFLLLVGLMWIACGIIALVGLSASWKLIPGIVFIGIGALFLRGAATTSARRDQ